MRHNVLPSEKCFVLQARFIIKLITIYEACCFMQAFTDNVRYCVKICLLFKIKSVQSQLTSFVNGNNFFIYFS